LVGPFDQGAAERAASELLITVQSLMGVLGALEEDRKVITEDWSGPFRVTFDAELDRLVATGGLLTETLQHMAVVVGAKAFEAQAAQKAEVAG
jgi:hypothetical protein